MSASAQWRTKVSFWIAAATSFSCISHASDLTGLGSFTPRIIPKAEMGTRLFEELLKSYDGIKKGCQRDSLLCASAALDLIPHHPMYLSFLSRMAQSEVIEGSAVDALRKAKERWEKMDENDKSIRKPDSIKEVHKKKGKGKKNDSDFYTKKEVQDALEVMIGTLGNDVVEKYQSIDPDLVYPLSPPKVSSPFMSLIHEYDSIGPADAVKRMSEALSSEVLKQYHKTIAEYKQLREEAGVKEEDPKTYNNRFFGFQREHFHEKKQHLFVNVPGFAILERAMRGAAEEMLRQSGMERQEAQVRSQTHDLFLWASVHGAGSDHAVHEHTQSAVSGVFYVQVPKNSAKLMFRDPRGSSYFGQRSDGIAAQADVIAEIARAAAQKAAVAAGLPADYVAGVIAKDTAEFAKEAAANFVPNVTDAEAQVQLPSPPFHRPFVVDVKEGKLVAFPGWMKHEVEENQVAEGSLRISISFNLQGDWHDTSSVALNLGKYRQELIEEKQKENQEVLDDDEEDDPFDDPPKKEEARSYSGYSLEL